MFNDQAPLSGRFSLCLKRGDGVGKHFCDAECKYNDNPEQICTAVNAGHVSRSCITYRKRFVKENYSDLMRTNVGICRRERGSMKRKGVEVLK